eukprot:353967-Chlamydomonas_euryale.AAC.3
MPTCSLELNLVLDERQGDCTHLGSRWCLLQKKLPWSEPSVPRPADSLVDSSKAECSPVHAHWCCRIVSHCLPVSPLAKFQTKCGQIDNTSEAPQTLNPQHPQPPHVLNSSATAYTFIPKP